FFSLMSHVRLYFLFYSCPCDHLDFHSFPTRRSSDLIVATAAELDGPLVIDGHGVFGEAADGQFMRARYGEVDLVATGNGQSEERVNLVQSAVQVAQIVADGQHRFLVLLSALAPGDGNAIPG